jgi:hypothetical protein
VIGDVVEAPDNSVCLVAMSSSLSLRAERTAEPDRAYYFKRFFEALEDAWFVPTSETAQVEHVQAFRTPTPSARYKLRTQSSTMDILMC